MNCAVHRSCKIWGTILDSPEKTGRFFLENYDDGSNVFTTVSRENTNFTKTPLEEEGELASFYLQNSLCKTGQN